MMEGVFCGEVMGIFTVDYSIILDTVECFEGVLIWERRYHRKTWLQYLFTER